MNNAFRPKRLTSYDDKSIINEIKRVLSKHFENRVPSMRDFNRYSMIFSGTITKRFGSWAKAMEKAGFKYDKAPLIASEMIKDLKRIRDLSQWKYFTQDFYIKNKGKYSIDTLKKYLGSSWQNMLNKTLSLKKVSRVVRIIRPKPKGHSEEDLFLEMKRVWDLLGRRPSYKEFRKNGHIGSKVYERRFGTWKKSVEKFCLKFNYDLKGSAGNEATPELLLYELKKITSKIHSKILLFKKYKELGGVYSIGTFQNHFGSWKNAIEKIGLKDGHSSRYSKEELFAELQRVWELIGRQPEYRDMKKYGQIHGSSFRHEFGSWIKAIHAFCLDREKTTENKEEVQIKDVSEEYAEVQTKDKTINYIETLKENREQIIVMNTRRTPSLRLRFQVLTRDGFRCKKCGRSPATHMGLTLEIDHKTPYSLGGETIFENLETLCNDCNRGKSNVL